MYCLKSLEDIQKNLQILLQKYTLISLIVHKIADKKGQSFLVGGSVRDLVMGLPIYDLDIEIHGLNLEELGAILAEFGIVSFVGKSFGVLKIHGYNIDWSLPRTDSSGRKPQVIINPNLNIVEALRRRDLTMNAMAINLLNFEFIDPFHGRDAIEKKILQSPDIHFFKEDPLRFYRVMQFVARFEMMPDETLNSVCRTMDIKGVSHERIDSEFKKLMLKSKEPSLGIRWLDYIDRLHEIMPELFATKNTAQSPEWHPEGYVFEHLMQTLDAAAKLPYNSEEEKLIVLYAALCHDLGKVSTTKLIDGKLRSFGHAEAGFPLTKALMKRLTRKEKLIDAVAVLVKYHMQPLQFVKQKASLAAYKRLAIKLDGHATLCMLAKLSLADRLGRNGASHKPLERDSLDDTFACKAQEAGVLNFPEKPLLSGKDIADFVEEGPAMGRVLKRAYELQIKENITDRSILREKIKRLLSK